MPAMKPTSLIAAHSLRRLTLPALSLALALTTNAQSTAPFLGIDADDNQISDLFQVLYPGTTTGSADNDSDGATNADEAAAGTNPNSNTDNLTFQSLVNTGSQVDASWRTVAGKIYQMQASSDLGNVWVDEGSPVAGTGGSVQGSCPVSGTRMFLRIKVSDTDSDADGVNDWEELQAGTDRYLWDTDGDGNSDRSLVEAIAAAPAAVNVQASSTWAAESGRTGSFRITRHGGFAPLTIPFSTAGSTATAGSDYTISSSGSIYLGPGVNSAQVTVTALPDALTEAAETVLMTLQPGSGYSLGSSPAATVTIVSQGLIGEYFDASTGNLPVLPATDANFTGVPALSRRDAAIDFDWLGTAPAPLVNDDLWVARWQGFIIPKYSELYQIHAIADRGLLVYVSATPITGTSGQIRINQGSTANPTTKYSANALTGSAALVAGQAYHIRVDYRDSSSNPNNSNIQIRWSSASQPEETIPSANLTSDGFTGAVPSISSPLYISAIAGAPFNYQIAATNAPATYSASGLPSGLTVGPTGLISGTLNAAEGYHFATITAANAAGSDTKNLLISVAVTGGAITREVWNGLTGTGVLSVPLHTAPSSTSTLTELASPENTGDNFGERLRGYITAPATGLYTFFLSSDENAELWISSSAEPGHRLKRSFVSYGAVPPGDWGSVASQRSLAMSMTAGTRYYIEAIRRETTAGDHLQIGWLKPGQTGTVPSEIVPGWALSPYAAPVPETPNGFLYTARLTPQSGVASLGAGIAILRVNQDKTAADLTVSFGNLTGSVTNSHIHDSRSVPGPVGAILFDIDDADPDRLLPGGDGLDPGEVYHWDIEATGLHEYTDVIAALEGGTAYVNLHTSAYPNGEITGFFQPVIGSQFFTPPAEPPPAELTLPTNPVERKNAIVRFLQQATFGARHDSDGSAPWDVDSIEAVEALGYAGWIDAQLAADKGPDPEILVTQTLPPRIQYIEPSAALPTLIPSGTATGYNGSGPMATYVKNYYEKFPISGVGTVGAPLESSEEIWRAWWRTAVKSPDQLRLRTAFALSQILVVSEDGELDEVARGLVHYHDLLYWHGTGNFRSLLERVTLNPVMGRYLDMLGNRKPDPSIGYIPNENFAREILQLFSIGLNRLHPDGSVVLSPAGLPTPTYEQPNVVGYAHTFTGWNVSNGANYVTAMVPTSGNHDFTEKLLLENTILPAATASTAQCNAELAASLDVIFHHPNVGPFISRQLIQRMVTANPSPGYIYRVGRVFDDNGSGVRGDLGAVVKAILLDPEARNNSQRTQPGFGHIKEPLVRAAQLLRAFKGFSYGEATFGSTNVLGTVSVSPNSNIDLSQPLPVTQYTRIGNRALFPGDIITLSGQTPSTENGLYIFNGSGLSLTPTTATPAVATYSTDLADIATSFIPTSPYPGVEGIPLTANARLLLRNQTNPAENGLYLYTSATAQLTRLNTADEPAELNGAVVTVAAYRDPATQAYSSKTFMQTATVTTIGSDPVVFADGSATSSGKRAWEIGTTGGGSLAQTPLRAPTVFNYFEPDYVFLGDTGLSGLYSPEFQITSETSVVNSTNWFSDFILRNDSSPSSPFTSGQGFSYGNPVKKDVKLDVSAALPFANDGGAIVDYMAGMLMPYQMTPRLRTLLVNYLNSFPETLTPALSEWKYFTDASGLGASNIVSGHASYDSNNWKHPNYVDTAWSSGSAVLGYRNGNTGITTVLPFGGNAASKWITSYFRREFTVTDAVNVGTLTLRLRRDDGAIVYINGVEAKRDNINTGVVATGTTLANGAGDDGAAFFDYIIPASLLVEGRNVVAVEVHQNSITSSDILFDLELRALRNGTPSYNVATPDRVLRATEALYLLSLSPEFTLQN